eukprot:5429392-Prymnesium_polylepis.2
MGRRRAGPRRGGLRLKLPKDRGRLACARDGEAADPRVVLVDHLDDNVVGVVAKVVTAEHGAAQLILDEWAARALLVERHAQRARHHALRQVLGLVREK